MSADKTDPRTLEAWLRSRIAEAAGVPSGEVGLDRELAELGIDSLRAAQVAAEIEERLARRFDASEIYDRPTIRRLAAYLSGGPEQASEERSRGPAAEPIAIVGMSCRFPGGGGLPGFWRLLASGGDGVSPGRGGDLEERLGRVWSEVGPMGPGGYIEGVDLFDAEFFRIAPVEARLMDPQQRLLLETTWEALEWAGIDPEGLRGSRTGVYTGISSHDYWDLLAACGGEDAESLYMATGASMSTAAGRIAFALGLEGPALAVDTASSSSLVAVHQAVTALQWGEADLALAGGVNVVLSPVLTEALRTGRMLSPDGRSKTFDASANGYVRGEGCGVVVLKRLRDAEASGDRIWGVIRGSAVNQDGASAGLTAPSGPAQERVIEEALSRAGLTPPEVDYLEAHGTGTELGDPIEVRAAAAAYGAGRDPGRPLLLGSVKTGIGHLEAAAGVAGLIKTVLSVAHGVVPKHLHFRTPSPHVEWQRLPVRVASEGEAWPVREGRPPRAGVSSFGISGTNAHVVVEGYGEAPEAGEALLAAGPAVAVSWPEEVARLRPEGGEAPAASRGRRLLPLSGRTEDGLRALAGRYLEWLEERAQSASDVTEGSPGSGGTEWLADAAWTAAVGRSHHGHRAGLTFGGVGELREKLAALAGGVDAAGAKPASAGGARVGFLFTGQGSQWAGMGRDLYESEPVFRAVLDRCEAEVRELRGESLLAVMFGDGQGAGNLDDTRWTQPALYALEAGLLELWRSVGVRPYAVLGHSVGEIAAAYAAGVFTLEAGARFAAVRGGLMGSVREVGAMAAVFGPADWVSELVAELNRDGAAMELGVAAYNGGHQVVSGAADAVAAALERCRSEGVRAERLRVSHAFHSGLMEPVLDELERAAEDLQASPPRVPLASNVTGRMVAPGEALDGAYWRRHAREPVAFAAGVRALAESGVDVLVEVGPRPVLGPMALPAWPAAGDEAGEAAGSSGESPGARPGGPLVLPSLRPPQQGAAGGFAEAAAGAYEAGLSLSFKGLFAGESRRRVTLPGYPFQRRRHWVDAESGPAEVEEPEGSWAAALDGGRESAGRVRRAAAAPGAGGTAPPDGLLERVRQAPAPEREDLLLGFVQRELRSVLGLPSLPAPGIGFFDVGMDSSMAMRLQSRLNRALAGIYEAPSTVAFDHPSCQLLARHLAEQLGVLDAPAPAAHRASATGGEEVAVVGMACRFPGGDGLAGFWRLLESGGDAVTEGRGRPLEVSAAAPWSAAAAEGTIRWGGFIEGLDLFDAEFFRIAPVEARLLDPQQRLLLETSWEALESAGTDAARLKGSRTGVYAGISSHDYWDLLTAAGGEDALALYAATGASGSTAIGRVAFALGLEGPVLAVDTACSSSLVAVHQAVSALQRGETDLALAGGVHVMLSPAVTESFRRGGMLSPDGRCKTFDASANGYVRGEGCGVVVLKRLRDAEADGDPIWGVARGSAINHDGASAGLTVPNGRAQERVIREALGRAGLAPQEVDYLEAHGTGTALGDPIEVNAAAAAYGAGRDPERPLRLGSVKSNVGHLEAAAGVAGLVKVLLSMAHGVIPRSLHFREPNPRVEWDRLPVQVVSEPEEWPLQEGRPARAGVSSFGFSGTNAHVVVEGYGAAAEARSGHSGGKSVPYSIRGRNPGLEGVAGRAVTVELPAAVSGLQPEESGAVPEARERRVLALSGRTEAALRELAGRYAERLEERAGLPSAGDAADGEAGLPEKEWLADMAWSAGVGRSHLGHRAGVTFGEAGELREKLAALAAGSEVAGAAPGRRTVAEGAGAPKVGFLFTGQGSQWAGMGRELYEREPVFRAVLDRCEAEVRELRGESLLAVMFGEGNVDADGSLDDTRWTQPALYALEAGLWALWRSVGVRPAAVMGHSVGEIAAAYAAGVFTLEEGVRFAAQRGELMGSLPSSGPGAGAMAAVFGSAAEVEELVGEVNGEQGREGLGLAAYNGLHQVVSGEVESVEGLLERCQSAGVRAERLRVSHGFHSAQMEPVLDELEGLLAGVEARGAEEAALVSNVTGRVMGSGERMDGVYWRRHAREPVAFGAGVAALAEMGVEVLVELGPGPVLGRMAALAWPQAEGKEGAEGSTPGAVEPVVVSSLWGRGRKGEASGSGSSGSGFEEAVAEAYAAGLEVGFAGMFAGEERRRVSLPGYPFQRQRYWVDGGRRGRVGGAEHPLLGGRHESARGETVFETELYATEPEWLRDHRVFGRVVAPGAMYGAMALMAASLCAGPEDASGGVTLTDMRFHVPLVLPEGSEEGGEPGRTVQVVLGAGDGSRQRSVEVYSSGEDESEWTLHAEVWAGVEASEAGGGADLEALKEGLWERDMAGFYRACADAGVEYGPSFRTVRALWSGSGKVVGEVSLSAELSEPGVSAHPVLLDGCLQLLMQAMKERAEEGGDGEGGAVPSYLPFGWERLWLSGALPERVTCRARLRESGSGAAAEVLSADLWLYGEDGTEVGGVSGLMLKRATRAALLAAGRGEELVHEVVWRPVSSGVEDGAVEGSVLLVNVGGGESGTVEALAAALAGRGVEVIRGMGRRPGAADGVGGGGERGRGGGAGEERGGGVVVGGAGVAAGIGAGVVGDGGAVRVVRGDGVGGSGGGRGAGGPVGGERVGIRAQRADGAAGSGVAAGGRGSGGGWGRRRVGGGGDGGVGRW